MVQKKRHSKAITLSSSGPLAFESIDTRLVSLMRLILAISALLIIYIDPSEPDRFVNLTYGLLGLYSFYSLVLYVLSVHQSSFLQRPFMHWLDVGWYVVLISLSHVTNNLFFFYFFFIILVASFRSGYLTGLSITIVSAILFTIVGYFTVPAGSGIELSRFLLRPTCLIVIGYLMAYWGGAEIVLKRRLALLNEVSKLSNPRFGVDQTIGSFMERLRSFYDAEACILIMSALGSDDYLLRHSYRDNQEHAIHAEKLEAEMRSLLLDWPSDSAVTYKAKGRGWWSRDSSCKAYNLSTGEQIEIDQERCEAIADLLGSESLVSVPLQRRDLIIGRLFLTSRERRFNHHDIDFLRQLVEHVVPIIDSIQLVDRLASEASEQERQKISRDIHDSAIQPYIGLKFGLNALSRKVASDDPLKGDINELLEVTNETIKDLRHYVGELQGERHAQREDTLISALHRQAAKFSEFYDVQVSVRTEAEINVNDRLAAEIFQLVNEGLSNVRRHTNAKQAIIRLERIDNQISLSIENDNPNGHRFHPFTPRSITERATSLGGEADVMQNQEGHTVVTVTIPI